MSFLFLNTALLAGAAAAAIPLVIHLFHRQKAVHDLLPTLRFLRAGLAATRRRMRLKNLLVLLLRILAVLFIVATLSRPAYMGVLFFREGTAPVSAVIVIDNSVSMAYKEAGRTRLDEAKRLACKAARALPPGGRVGLVVTGAGPRGESLDREFTFTAGPLCARVMALEISAHGGDVAEAVGRAYEMLSREDSEPLAGGREVYVFSDLARHTWGGFGSLTPGEKTATIVLDVGSEAGENFHVESAAAEWRTGPSPHVLLTAVLAGGRLGASRLVEVHLDGAKRAEKLLEIPANSRTETTFEISLLEGREGPLQGWVALADADPVMADNSFYLSVSPRREISCLVLSENPAESSPDTGFFVRSALEPAGLKGATVVGMEAKGSAEFTAADLAGKDCLVMCDLEAPPGEIWEAVEGFCEGGGGLVLFLGERARGESYARFLSRHLGLVPGAVRRAPRGEHVALSVVSFDHPILRAFAGGRNGNLAAVRFNLWRPLTPAPSSAVSPVELARFDGGQPAILTVPVGEGKLVAAAFSPVRSGGDIVLRSVFVPLVNEIVTYAAGGTGVRSGPADAGHLVGEPVVIPVEKADAAARVLISTPLGERPVEVAANPGARGVFYTGYFPGNYVAKYEGPAEMADVGFSINLDPRESDLRRISPADIEAAVEGTVVVRDLSQARAREAKGATRGAREVFDLFLVAAIAILTIEAYIANRFYREGGGR